MSTKNAFLSKYSKKQPQQIDSRETFERARNIILGHNLVVLDDLACSLGFITALENDFIFRGYFQQIPLSPFRDFFIDTKVLQDAIEIAKNNLDHSDNNDSIFLSKQNALMMKISTWKFIISSKLDSITKEEINSNSISYIDERFREKTIELVNDYPSSFNELVYQHHNKNDLSAFIKTTVSTIGYIKIQNEIGIVNDELMRMFLNTALFFKESEDSFINTTKWNCLYNYLLKSILDIINEKLEMEICIDDFRLIDNSDEEALCEIWEEVTRQYEKVISMNSGQFEYPFSLNDELEGLQDYLEDKDEDEQHIRVISDPQPDSKASAAILKFFDSNSNALIAKLKDSGLQLSAAALQNDQNITRVANVVYNLLPGMVRIFVSFDTVENFLLEHRQWLINKLI